MVRFANKIQNDLQAVFLSISASNFLRMSYDPAACAVVETGPSSTGGLNSNLNDLNNAQHSSSISDKFNDHQLQNPYENNIGNYGRDQDSFRCKYQPKYQIDNPEIMIRIT